MCLLQLLTHKSCKIHCTNSFTRLSPRRLANQAVVGRKMDRAVVLAQPRELARQSLQARKKQMHLPFDVSGRSGFVQHHVAEGLADAQVHQFPRGRRRLQAGRNGLASLGAKGLRDVALGDALDRCVHVDGFHEDLRYVADDLHRRPGLRDDHCGGCRCRGQVVELDLHGLQAMDVH